MCSCVLAKVEHSTRQQGARCGKVKQAVEKRNGLRRQSRLECMLLHGVGVLFGVCRANGCWYQCNGQVGRGVVTIAM